MVAALVLVVVGAILIAAGTTAPLGRVRSIESRLAAWVAARDADEPQRRVRVGRDLRRSSMITGASVLILLAAVPGTIDAYATNLQVRESPSSAFFILAAAIATLTMLQMIPTGWFEMGRWVVMWTARTAAQGLRRVVTIIGAVLATGGAVRLML